MPPEARRISSRAEVVCLPLRTALLISPVTRILEPESVFIKVDLPTPEEPIKTAEIPGFTNDLRSFSVDSSKEEIAKISLSGATFFTSSKSSLLLSHKSDFVNKITDLIFEEATTEMYL